MLLVKSSDKFATKAELNLIDLKNEEIREQIFNKNNKIHFFAWDPPVEEPPVALELPEPDAPPVVPPVAAWFGVTFYFLVEAI